MPTPGAATISAVIRGDDLCLAQVGAAVGRPSVRELPTLRGFLAMPPDQARAALGRLTQGPITLTCPGAWCAVRPVQITRREWGSARDEILRSIDRLLPLTPDEAVAGLIDIYDENGDAVEARLIGLRRAQLQPWLDAIERVFNRPVDRVLSPHMAMLGLGLQSNLRSFVYEPTDGFLERHELRFGLPTRLGEAAGEDTAPDAPAVILPDLVSGQAPPRVDGVEPVSARDLAIGAALASSVTPETFAPLIGRSPRQRPRWVAPVLIAAAAAALALTAVWIDDERLREATAQARARQASLEPEVERVQELRRAADRYIRLLREGVGEATEGWRSVLPDLAEAHAALGEQGFYQRIEVSADALSVRGEARSWTEVLERLEESPRFRDAAAVSPVSKSSVSGFDVFELRADRRGGEASK